MRTLQALQLVAHENATDIGHAQQEHAELRQRLRNVSRVVHQEQKGDGAAQRYPHGLVKPQTEQGIDKGDNEQQQRRQRLCRATVGEVQRDDLAQHNANDGVQCLDDPGVPLHGSGEVRDGDSAENGTDDDRFGPEHAGRRYLLGSQ